MKIGAACFCIGQILHIFIILTKQVFFVLDENHDCFNSLIITESIFHAIYVFLQLFMIFKYSNVIVNQSKRIASVAFMHCLASSLCFWIYTIISETVDNVVKGIVDNDDGHMKAVQTCSEFEDTCVDDDEIANFGLEMDCYVDQMCHCLKPFNQTESEALGLFNVIPYTYPFSIEFSILVGKSCVPQQNNF